MKSLIREVRDMGPNGKKVLYFKSETEQIAYHGAEKMFDAVLFLITLPFRILFFLVKLAFLIITLPFRLIFGRKK